MYARLQSTSESYFDGDDYVDAGVLDVEGDAMTLLARVRPQSFSVPDARIVAKATGLELEDQYWMIGTTRQNDEPRLRFRLQTDHGVRDVVSTSAIRTDDWLFVAAVYDGREMMLYLDGELAGRFSQRGRIKTNSHAHVWFGDSPAGAGSRPWDGALRDVAVFEQPLSAERIQAIFRAKQPPPVASRGDAPPETEAPPETPEPSPPPRARPAPAESIAPPAPPALPWRRARPPAVPAKPFELLPNCPCPTCRGQREDASGWLDCPTPAWYGYGEVYQYGYEGWP